MALEINPISGLFQDGQDKEMGMYSGMNRTGTQEAGLDLEKRESLWGAEIGPEIPTLPCTCVLREIHFSLPKKHQSGGMWNFPCQTIRVCAFPGIGLMLVMWML